MIGTRGDTGVEFLEFFRLTDAYTAGNPLTSLTARVVSAYIGSHTLPMGKLPDLIGQVHAALDGLGSGEPRAPEPDKLIPAVPVRKSVHNDYLVCLEDGKRFKMLKRHLMSHYGMTLDDYRKRWDLPTDYPMVAPAYAAKRSELAKSFGLGQVRGKAVAVSSEPVEEPREASSKRRPRKA